jgi:hypothetical protein
MKKFIKLISSRMFFLVLGIVLVIAIYAVQAAWDTTYSTGDTLTATGFNDMVNKLIDLEAKTVALQADSNALGTRVGTLESACLFGGYYTEKSGNCNRVNPLTGGCSCPAGYSAGATGWSDGHKEARYICFNCN